MDASTCDCVCCSDARICCRMRDSSFFLRAAGDSSYDLSKDRSRDTSRATAAAAPAPAPSANSFQRLAGWSKPWGDAPTVDTVAAAMAGAGAVVMLAAHYGSA